MKYYMLILYMGLIVILGGCEKANHNGRECVNAGCRLEGENYYLVDQARVFPQMDVCRDQIENDKEKHDIRILYKEGGGVDSGLYISGGVDLNDVQYKFICEKRYYESGFIYYFAKEESGNSH